MHPADPIAALRQATSAQHAILDSSLPLARPDADLADYVNHLRMLAQWLRPIDAWLARFDDGPQGPGCLPPLARVARIEADLAEAGAGEMGDVVASPWPVDASAAYRWGVVYVVEGSQLGGVVLYQRLAAQLAPHRLAYLKGGLDGPGPRWRAVTSALREQLSSDAAVADACDGACAAFARILLARPGSSSY